MAGFPMRRCCCKKRINCSALADSDLFEVYASFPAYNCVAGACNADGGGTVCCDGLGGDFILPVGTGGGGFCLTGYSNWQYFYPSLKEYCFNASIAPAQEWRFLVAVQVWAKCTSLSEDAPVHILASHPCTSIAFEDTVAAVYEDTPITLPIKVGAGSWNAAHPNGCQPSGSATVIFHRL